MIRIKRVRKVEGEIGSYRATCYVVTFENMFQISVIIYKELFNLGKRINTDYCYTVHLGQAEIFLVKNITLISCYLCECPLWS